MRVVVDDLLANGVRVVALPEGDFEAADGFQLDFDDAYRYGVAKIYGLKRVGFDRRFTRAGIAPD